MAEGLFFAADNPNLSTRLRFASKSVFTIFTGRQLHYKLGPRFVGANIRTRRPFAVRVDARTRVTPTVILHPLLFALIHRTDALAIRVIGTASWARSVWSIIKSPAALRRAFAVGVS